jgi:hypothetical protein
MSASQQQELQARAELQPARRASAQVPRQLVLVPQEQPALLVSERQARVAPQQELAASAQASRVPARQLQELPLRFPVAHGELSPRLQQKWNSSASFSRLRRIPAAGQ